MYRAFANFWQKPKQNRVTWPLILMMLKLAMKSLWSTCSINRPSWVSIGFKAFWRTIRVTSQVIVFSQNTTKPMNENSLLTRVLLDTIVL